MWNNSIDQVTFMDDIKTISIETRETDYYDNDEEEGLIILQEVINYYMCLLC